MNAAETILQANPNVKVFAAVNDAGALGAMESIRASGIDTTGFYVGGLDATEEALEKIADPNGIYRATVDLDPKGSGKMAIDTIMKVIKDGPIPEYIYMEMKPVKQKGF
jgi:ABC-type sugar transport system substrate-binding protein